MLRIKESIKTEVTKEDMIQNEGHFTSTKASNNKTYPKSKKVNTKSEKKEHVRWDKVPWREQQR